MGSGFRTFQSGEVLTSSNVQNYLMDQAISVFAGTASRGSAITSPETGMVSYRTDGTADAKREGFEFYDGTNWVRLVPASTSPALVVVKSETAFTTSSSITIDNIFTATYRNYKILVNYTTSTTSGPRLRMRASGSSTSTATYNEQYVQGAAETASASRGASSTSIFIGPATNGSFNSSMEITFYNPQVATATTVHAVVINSSAAYTAPQIGVFGGNQTGSTSFDGFELFPSSGTLTGNYTVYGLATS